MFSTLVNQLPGFIFGVISALIIAFGSGFINLFFKGIDRRSTHRLNVARHVLQLCNEASGHGYRTLPRDPEHLISVITNLEGINNKMSIELEKFLSSWSIFAERHMKGDLNSDEITFAKEMLDRAEDKRKILIVWANEVRAGNPLINFFKRHRPFLGVFSNKRS